MNLYLLRHAEAFDADVRFSTDGLRPLTEKGGTRARAMGKAMRRVKIDLSLIWSSPYLRARQTAEIVAEELGFTDRLALRDRLAPDGDLRQLMDDVSDLDSSIENLLLTGHEPLLSMLLSVLTTGTANLRVDFKKCSLAKLKLTNRIGFERCATLSWLVPSRLFP